MQMGMPPLHDIAIFLFKQISYKHNKCGFDNLYIAAWLCKYA